MKTFLILFTLLFSLTGKAITKQQIDQLLKEKGTSLIQFESQGAKAILGEVTGVGKAVPFTKVEAVLTKDEAILRHEIEAVDFKKEAVLGQLESLRVGGSYILGQDIKAVIVK